MASKAFALKLSLYSDEGDTSLTLQRTKLAKAQASWFSMGLSFEGKLYSVLQKSVAKSRFLENAIDSRMRIKTITYSDGTAKALPVLLARTFAHRYRKAHRVTLAADDRLFLCADGTILDHAVLRKFGTQANSFDRLTCP